MNANSTIIHRFVDHFPDVLEQGVLYVSVEFCSITHLCLCGCGMEVITPLNPNDWRMIFDGETNSLEPSIGNWSLPCQSHYFIRRSRIQWAGPWTNEQIRRGRENDIFAKRGSLETKSAGEIDSSFSSAPNAPQNSFLERIKRWFLNHFN